MRILDRRAVLPALLMVVVGCGGAMASGKEAQAIPPADAAQAPPPPPSMPGATAEESGSVTGVTFASAGLARRTQSDISHGGAAGAKREPAPAPKSKAPEPQQTPTGQQGVQTEQAVQKQTSIIIYSAQLNMAVFEVESSMKHIEDLAKQFGGFLAKREDKTIIIRIPADRFDEALHGVEKMGDMLHRAISAEDVTEEFRDLEVRLKGSKAVQERLTQLLAKATKVEESIAIERELDRITMEIDRVEGRMKFLRDRAAFSTITIIFQPKSSENVSQNPFHMPTPWLSQLGLSRLFQL